MPPENRNDPAGNGVGSQNIKAGSLLVSSVPAGNDCCREATAEVFREVNAALEAIKAAADVLATFAPMLDGFTYTKPDDDPADEPRNAYDEAIMAATFLDSEVEALHDRVRRVAWLHDLDHAAGRAR